MDLLSNNCYIGIITYQDVCKKLTNLEKEKSQAEVELIKQQQQDVYININIYIILIIYKNLSYMKY